MPRVIELVNVPPAITWEILEPLALALLTSAAVAVLLAGVLVLAGRSGEGRRTLFATGIASAMTGMGALALSLGNPFHLYMFMISPAFSSWTTIGTFLLPVFLGMSLLALYLDAGDDGMARPVAGLAILFALGVLVYASREIGYLKGRVMWTSAMLPFGFALAGLSGGAGLAALLGGLRRQAAPGWLLLAMSGASLACAGAGFLLTPPEGYVLAAPGVWNALSLIGVVGAVLGLIALKARGLASLAGLVGYGAGLGFFVRLIFLGQAVPRKSFTAVDAGAAAHLVSAQSLLSIAGSLVFLVGLGLVLKSLFSNVATARKEHSHG
ncbi:polysulfide reductase NrfD [Pseudodesulfovibrio thermohalotolerans]|uniref:NrfD/PsrC family molybdoenzyme membrane anchor subunit n=1 Tax=Pseudodesulfovibrio thermohalotolerans TaxID=2880651 RepID=UPI0024421640|nr:NrfD/PsrC family molybdoenzyme membrane anchor subunit [Pseudodesulfovibrio thermohalotolerans]WFS63342.1 polysulfide reductase NrfD [Pseudodesulfovibrio thermohalotolerans]